MSGWRFAINSFISSETYKSPNERTKSLFGYRLLEEYNKPEYCVYKNDEIKHLIIGFRGTVPTRIKDIGSDILLGLGLEGKSRRFAESLHVFDELKSRFPNYKITSTGHSLSGSIAEHIGMKRNIHSVSFNAGAGLSSLLGKHNERGIRYRTKYDPVSLLNKSRSIEVSQKGLKPHSISNFVPVNSLS